MGYTLETPNKTKKIKIRSIDTENQEKYYEKNLSTQEKTEEQSTRIP